MLVYIACFILSHKVCQLKNGKLMVIQLGLISLKARMKQILISSNCPF